jgi:hypothetical protein
LTERVFRELASMVGYVDDFDLAEEAAQEAFARAEAAPDGHDVQRMVVSAAQVPIGASNARSGRDAGTNMPTHRVPAESESRWQPTLAASRSPPPRPCLRRPLARPSTNLLRGRVEHLGGGTQAPALRGKLDRGREAPSHGRA